MSNPVKTPPSLDSSYEASSKPTGSVISLEEHAGNDGANRVIGDPVPATLEPREGQRRKLRVGA